MADNLIKIDSGTIKIQVQIDNNPPAEIEFNPSNKLFAERLHAFYFEVKEKLVEINSKQALNLVSDENGMPVEIKGLMQEYEDINAWLKEKIDLLLGEGTSQKIYGDTVYMGERVDVYLQLFEGLFRIANPVREKQVKKYVKKRK